MLAQKLIRRKGQPALRIRKNPLTYGDFGEPATYSADSIIGFLAITDTKKTTSHGREPEGDVEGIDLRLLCGLDDTGTLCDIRATKDGIPDIIHFEGAGVFDVQRVDDFNHPMTRDRFFGINLRRREHIKTSLSISALYDYVFGGNFDIDLSFTAEDGGDLTSEDVYAEALISGAWDRKTMAYVSGSKWRFAGIDWPAGDYRLRIRYDGDDIRQGAADYINITIEAA